MSEDIYVHTSAAYMTWC